MSGEQKKRSVLLLAHGTPDVLGEMAAYLDKVTGGRPIPQHVVEELQHRYAQIGLRDVLSAEPPPLTKWTMRQAELLQEELAMRVYVGMRNWKPFIADTVEQMKCDDVTYAKVICLAPQNSRTSTGLYKRALMAAVGDSFSVDFVEGWSQQPRLIEAFAERLLPALKQLRAEAKKPAVLFTAHSVPLRTVQASEDAPADPYADEARKTAALVAASVCLEHKDWVFAFQSQGMSGGPWIGPTVEETLRALKVEGHDGVVIQPVGFVCDHVEVLYDIDIAFQELAREIGLKLWRAESLNDSPLLIKALADVATEA
jgi:ferrochelatase